MKIKDIIESYKSKKQELKNKSELKEIKKSIPKPEKNEQGIKNILFEYKNKIKEKEQKEVIKGKQDELNVEVFFKEVVNHAFENLKEEFDKYGEDRIVQLNFKPLQTSLTVYCEQKQEYIYRITIKNGPENPSANIIIYHITPDGEISTGKEEKLLTNKKIEEITEEDVRKDFYSRYKDYLMSLVDK
jgi:hypothetical protein